MTKRDPIDNAYRLLEVEKKILDALKKVRPSRRMAILRAVAAFYGLEIWP